MSPKTMSALVVVAVALFAAAEAFEAGAPAEACDSMIPKHLVDPQATPSPYSFAVSKSSARAGEPIQLTISGKGPNDLIRGFLVQGLVGKKVVGHFNVAPNDKFVQPLKCGNVLGDAVTHRKHPHNQDKKSLTLTWIPPTNFNGDVEFRATIVRDVSTFWVAQKSPSVKIY